MFWILTAALFTLAMLFVLVPLLRKRDFLEDGEQLREEANISLFKERERELEAELAAKNIDVSQFELLILELKQNLLSDVTSENRVSAKSKKMGRNFIIQETQGLTYKAPARLARGLDQTRLDNFLIWQLRSYQSPTQTHLGCARIAVSPDPNLSI